MLSSYFHLSSDYDLEGIWKPRSPTLFEDVKDAKGYSPSMTEPRTPRICLSPSLEGCFYAIYPNIYSLFEVQKYPHLDFCVYRAYIDDQDQRFKDNDSLVKNRTIWDAHVTKEVWYTDDLKMVKSQIIRCTPNQKKLIFASPFNDPEQESRFIAPEVKIEVIKRFPGFYSK